MRLKVLAAIGIAVSSLALSACSSGGPGGGTATSTNAATSSSGAAGSSSGSDSAPKVSNPISVGSYEQEKHACTLFSSAQLQALHLSSAKTEAATQAGTGCKWNDDNADFSSTVAFYPNDGLGYFYQNQSKSKGDFTPITVGGYPAVKDGNSPTGAMGDCDVEVGLSDTTSFEVFYGGSTMTSGPPSNACDLTQQAAGWVLDKLKVNGGK